MQLLLNFDFSCFFLFSILQATCLQGKISESAQANFILPEIPIDGNSLRRTLFRFNYASRVNDLGIWNYFLLLRWHALLIATMPCYESSFKVLNLNEFFNSFYCCSVFQLFIYLFICICLFICLQHPCLHQFINKNLPSYSKSSVEINITYMWRKQTERRNNLEHKFSTPLPKCLCIVVLQ